MSTKENETPVLDAIMANDEDIRARYRQLMAPVAEVSCGCCAGKVDNDSQWKGRYRVPMCDSCVSNLATYGCD